MKRAIAAVLALILALSLCGCGGTGSTSSGERTLVAARRGEDGAFLVTEAQNISFDTPLKSGYITADRGHIITLTEDGTLSYSDGNRNNVVEIAKNVGWIGSVRNDGFFYEDENTVVYRVKFGETEGVKLAEDIAFVAADNTVTALYATGDGGVYMLAADSTDAEKVGTFEDQVKVVDISDNANIAVWLLIDEGNSYSKDECTPVIWNSGEKKTCASYSTYVSDLGVEFSKDQKLAVVGPSFGNTVYIVKEEEETEKFTVPDELLSYSYYTSSGRVNECNAADISAVYFTLVNDSSVWSIYGLTLDGDKERLRSDVNVGFRLENGTIVYRDEDNTLYYAPIASLEMGEEKKISGDVQNIRLPKAGEYVFFTRNDDGETGTLCAYSTKDDSVQKISGSVYGSSIYVGADGATVYYFKNVQTAKDGDTTCGDLYRWTYAKKGAESEKIATDVLTDSLTSYLTSGIEKNNFLFERFNGITEKDGENYVSYDLMKYNGRETEKLQSELLK